MILEITLVNNEARYVSIVHKPKVFANMRMGLPKREEIPTIVFTGVTQEVGEGSSQAVEPQPTSLPPSSTVPGVVVSSPPSHASPPPNTSSPPPNVPLPPPTVSSPPPIVPLYPTLVTFSPPSSPIAQEVRQVPEVAKTHEPSQSNLRLLISQMMTRIESLDAELKDTKKLYADSFITLTPKVKDLEIALGERKRRRRIGIIDSDEKAEPQETIFVTPEKVKTSGEAQEKISPNTLEVALTLSKVAINQPVSTYKRRGKLILDGKKIRSGLDMFSAAKENISVGDVVCIGLGSVSAGSDIVCTGGETVSTAMGVSTAGVIVSTGEDILVLVHP